MPSRIVAQGHLEGGPRRSLSFAGDDWVPSPKLTLFAGDDWGSRGLFVCRMFQKYWVIVCIFRVGHIFATGCGGSETELAGRALGRLVDAQLFARGLNADQIAELWGWTGSALYPQTASLLKQRAQQGERLLSSDKEALRRIYGDLVDRVWIHWNTPRITEIGDGFVLIPADSADFQTYGYHIFSSYDRNMVHSRKRIKRLIHELKHVEQFEELGHSLEEFGYRYFKAYYRAGKRYDRNPFEKEARNEVKFQTIPVFHYWQSIYKRY